LGLLIAKKAKEKGVKEAILDLGLNKSVPGSRIFAVLKGAVDNSMQIPYSDSIVPKEDRISGKHIEDYAKKLKENAEEFNKRFSSYIKNNADPLTITKAFNDMKNKITGA
jgi:large subunit ribosomal protein L18